MVEKEYDVVIVGAGPAGSKAAKVIAEKKHSVLVLDKKQEIGTPKRCAEGLNMVGLLKAGLKPDPVWAVNKINGVVMHAPSGKTLSVVLEDMEGYILERKIFEKHLAADAIREGAEYMVKTRATEVIKEDGFVKGVKAEYMGEEFKINARIVIAADGVDSKIARSAGIDTKNLPEDYHSGFQYEMAGINLKEADKLHLFFGEKIAPSGYAWIFPKDRDVGNVGLGISGRIAGKGSRAQDYLDRFIESNPEIFKDASPIEINAGGIPVGAPIDDFVGNGLMIVGDAAHQVNPIHGGGISLALGAGMIAGEVASEALEKGDVSRETLYKYQERWSEEYGSRLKKLLKLRLFIEKLSDKEFELFAEKLTAEDVVRLTKPDYVFMIKILAKNAPRMAVLAKKLLV